MKLIEAEKVERVMKDYWKAQVDKALTLTADVNEANKRINSYLEHNHELLKLIDELPSAQPEIVRCEDCRWGRKVCGNIECFVDSNIPTEYHGYEWFCQNGERRTDE